MLQKESLNPRENIFHSEICNNLRRILSLVDTDKSSSSYGLGDRYYWAWGLSDFGNATFQGLAHGLSRLWISGLWPFETDSVIFMNRIHSLFIGAKNLTRNDGSLEEAFPNEGSYCVTALVAFDLLVTIDLLQDSIDKERKSQWLKIIEPMICYLIKSDETHALISNHLATAVAALFRWSKERGGDQQALSKGGILLDEILKHQSKEGWFKEYEGADPGYQSLCTYYLSDVHLIREDLNLFEPLRRSIRFLWYFANPDGSFGGYCGSRSTKFFYPAGILALANQIPEAHCLSVFMTNSILGQKVVGLSSMDEPNLSPMFNSYAWAASLVAKEITLVDKPLLNEQTLPCEINQPYRRNFPDAGIIIDRGFDYYSIINYKKGGVVQHYVGDKLETLDTGVVFQSAHKKLGSNQHYDKNLCFDLSESKIMIRNQVAEMPKKLATPFKFLVLRIFCLTIFRFSSIRELTKCLLVKYLITKPKRWPIWNEREIYFGDNLTIEDMHEIPRGYKKLEIDFPFVPIHMASKGYWQIQDETSIK